MIKSKNPRAITTHESTICAKPFRNLFNIYLALFAALLSIASFSAQAADPVVNTVPWVPANRLIPHETWSGKEITLKAAADVQGGNYSYTWDFGDSSPVVTGTVTDRFVIDARHTYVGTPGDVFTARLTVENTSTGETGSDTYFVQVREKTLETEVNVAIDEGLWYLHRWQTRTTEGGVDYGDWRARSGCSACSTWFAITAANINAFAAQGHPAAGAADNPYTETVQRAMRRLVTYLRTESISNRTYPDIGTVSPDSNGNGLGVRVNQTLYPYQGGLFMDAIIAAGEPDTFASTGPAGISGRSYADIVQDMVDSYAFGQYNLGSNRGGWRYSWNQGPDNSAAQWGAIGLIPAERLWGLTVPEWVKSQNAVWLAFSQTTTGTEAGRFGYTTTNPSSWGPYAVTPSGMVQMVMDGMGRGDNRWDLSETWIRDRFANTCTSSNLRTCARTAIKDYYYGLFSFVKSMRLHEPAIEILQSQTSGVAPIDWYAAELSAGDPTDGVARTLVNDQQANGAWIGNYYESRQQPFNTPWAIIMLGQTLFEAGSPVAVGQATPNPGIAGQSISLNGTGSFHQDPERTIVGWEWDLDNDGAFETLGVSVATSFPVLGDFPVNLRVTDDSTPPRTAETTVIVRITIPPLPPTADAGGPYSFCPNQSWFLDGTGSINPDEGQSEPGAPGDTIQQYAWDLDGDGSFDDALGSQTDVTGYFGALGVGDYLVNLQVTDTTSTSFPSSSQPDLTDAGAAQVRVRDAADAACTCISDLTARPKSGQVQLVWTDTGATSYNVYRGTTAGGPYQFLATTDSRYSTYLDRTVENGTQYFFVVRETSPNGAERCQSIEATATPNSRRSANNAPVVVSTPPTAAVAQMLYRYDVDAVDADSDVVSYSLDLAPAGMTIDAASGLIEWTPVQAQVGTQNVTVRVSDPAGAADTQAWQILVSDINAPPAIVSSPVVDATEGQLYSYDVDAIDPNAGDTLTYSLDVAPAGMTMDPASGLIEWTPGAAQIGPNAVTVRVTDADSLFDTQTYTIDVVSANNPPAITSTPVVTGTEGQLYSYDVEAIDPDAGDTLTFSLDTAPTGMTIDAASGLIQWTPAGTQLGDNAVTVRADDGNGGIATQSYTIAVSAPPNQAPSITSTPVVDATEAVLYTYDVEATDPDSGDVLTFSLDLAPAGMSIDPASGLIQWTPAGTQLGDNAVTVRADDGNGGIATQSYTIAVSAPPNQAPSITSTPVVDATEAELYTYDVEATDPDSGDTLTFSLDLAPAGMTIDPASGLIQWTPADTQLGDNAVAVRVADGNGGSATQSYTIAVSAPPNQAPSITSTPVVVATEAVLYTYDVEATDPDAGDTPTFSLDVAPTGMTIDAASGLIQWTPADTQLGGNAVTVRADDGNGGIATQSYTITVSAAANQAPSITSVPGTNATEGLLYTYDVEATDPDAGDTLTFSLDLAPAGMTVDAASGLIQWTPADTQLGGNAVTVRVADGNGGFATQSYTISVSAPANQAPSITSTPVVTATEAVLYTYDVEATDPDAGDTLTFSLDLAPAGMTINATSGLIQWTPADTQLGGNAVTVRVADGNGGFATQSYAVTVSAPANEAPSITSAPPVTARATFEYQYQVTVDDPDGDVIAYSVETGPAGMVIDGNGLLSWTPDAAGIESVVVRASDGQAFADQGWTITVSDAGIPLEATISATPAVADLGSSVDIAIGYSGAAGAVSITLEIDGQPVAVDAAGMATVLADAVGIRTATATVSDAYTTDTATTTYSVIDPNANSTPPVVTLTAPASEEEVTAPRDAIGSVTDPENDLLSWFLAIQPRGAAPTDFTTIATGTTEVSNNVLGQIDPTMLLNGLYSVILQATDAAGNVSQDVRVIRVTGDLKIGNFSITFEDLSAPVAGIPVTVLRTYDTRRRNENLDFGYGWTVDYQNVRIQESRDIGFSWSLIEERAGFFSNWCVRPNGDPTVTVRMPDGEIESFVARAQPECTQIVPTIDVQIVFEPTDGTDTRLEQTDFGLVRLVNNNIVDLGEPGTPIDPDRYRLTTPEGTVYQLDQNFGIRQVIDTHGNTVTYSDAGVVHSQGFSIDFIRDGQGRITDIVTPDGASMTYAYDANGDLVSFTDQVMQTTGFTYNIGAEHYLEDIIDPRGIRVSRNEYDDDGRLVATIDADGNRIEYTHDIVGRMETLRDRRGNSSIYIYDDEGNVLLETNALGETITRTYDADRNVLSKTDDLGHTITWTYDERGNQLTETNALMQTTTSTFDSRNLLLSMVDGLGKPVMTNTYDANSTSLLTLTDANMNTTTYHWDAGIGGGCSTGASRGTTDALNNRFTIQPQCFGPFAELPAWQEDERGVRTSFAYDDLGRVISETTTRTDEFGVEQALVTTMEYDAKGRLFRVTDPENNVTVTEYNSIDLKSAVIDANLERTEFEYDDRGNHVLTRYPDLTTELIGYDEEGNVVSRTDRLSRTTRMVYDAANRHVETIYPDDTPGDDLNNPRRVKEYDRAGRLTATIDERGNRTESEYDEADRRILLRDALLRETRFEFDARGVQTAMVDALGRRTEFVHDDVGRLLETIFHDDTPGDNSDNLRSLTTYDALGRRSSETDLAGQTTTFEYDEVGNLTAVVDVTSQRTEYGYDEQSNRVSQTDAELRTTRWAYDNAGRMIARTLPEGQRESFAYDGNGNRVSHTDFNSDTHTFVFDGLNRETSANYADGITVATTYSQTGQVESVTDDRGATAYTYDERERVTGITYPNGKTINYGYDAAGNRTSLTTLNQLVNYSFDALNRLETVSDEVGVTAYAYDEVGNPASVDYPNGTRTSYVYDALNRLTETSQFDTSGGLIDRHTYTLGPNGNRLQHAELGLRVVDYVYDDLYRLTSESVTDPTLGNRDATWTYDAVGNRLTQTETSTAGTTTTTYAYDLNDRLTSAIATGLAVGTQTLVYDDNGNMESMSDGIDTTIYNYDSRNRLTDVVGQVTYKYDAAGVRMSETSAAGVTTDYLIDPNRQFAQVVEESVDANSFAEVRYTYGDDLIHQHRRIDASNTATSTFHVDGIGSTRQLTDSAGAVTDSYVFSAFGDLEASSGTTVNKYLFTGEQFDPNLGFYYLRARYLNPEFGRFQNMDTFAGCMFEPLTLNKYLYANSDPIDFIDPSGLVSQIGMLTAGQNVRVVLTQSARTSLRLQLRRVKRNLCRVAGTGMTNAHHAVPVFMGTPRNGNPVNLVNIDQTFHVQFHQLLRYMLRLRGFMSDNAGKEAWEALFKKNVGSRDEALTVLVQAAKIFDKACKLKGQARITPVIKKQIAQGKWDF